MLDNKLSELTQLYILSGMTCNACVSKVRSELLKLPEVISADVTLAPQQAIVTSSHPLGVDHLQHAVSKAGHYVISNGGHPAHENIDPPAESITDWLALYKPILLIFAFISAISTFNSYRGHAIHGMVFMQTFMAGFFLVFSFFKFLDLKSFAASYAMYDLLAMKLPAYGWIYPFIELALGLAFLTGFYPFLTGMITLIIMGFSSIGVIQSVISKKKIRCACLGAVFNFPMSTVTIIEDLLMVVMAAVMVTFY